MKLLGCIDCSREANKKVLNGFVFCIPYVIVFFIGFWFASKGQKPDLEIERYPKILISEPHLYIPDTIEGLRHWAAGYTGAQYTLALRYASGDGVIQDYAEAVKWYRRAAEQGHAESQHNLGLCFSEGKGVPKDEAEAIKWFRKSAEQGQADAIELLREIEGR